MDINKLFAGDWLKADDFGEGEARAVTVKHVAVEKVGDDDKPVVYFLEGTQGLVLNKTNAAAISALYGPDTEAWAGRKLTLFQSWVDYAGKRVKAIRVRACPQPAVAGSSPAAAPAAGTSAPQAGAGPGPDPGRPGVGPKGQPDPGRSLR